MLERIPDFSKVRAFVVGDVMLDRYVHGRVRRISPEAPVPVFNSEDVSCSAGGAANVALNCAALGCRVRLVGAVGSDEDGDSLGRILDNAGVKRHFSFARSSRTTCKTRFVVDGKQILRMDHDGIVRWREREGERFVRWASCQLKHVDILLLSDYGKGILSDSVCRGLITAACRAGIPVVVDPKGRDFDKYRGATLIKPNLKEFCDVTGCAVDALSSLWQEDVSCCAVRLGKKLSAGSVVVTLGDKGMLCVPVVRGAKPLYLPTEAKEVFDVSGAGDTSMAVLSAALAAKASLAEAVRLANVASGIAVAKSGTTVVSAADLEIANCARTRGKVVTLDECARVTSALKNKGKVIGFTNGCFDCCHLGHIRSIQAARKLCDVLVVGVNSDAWITLHKGKNRPIQDEDTRVGVLSALECVDFIVVFSTLTALPLVKKIRPDVVAKEGYALEDWPEGRYVKSVGGKAVVLKRIKGYSTTSVARRIREDA